LQGVTFGGDSVEIGPKDVSAVTGAFSSLLATLFRKPDSLRQVIKQASQAPNFIPERISLGCHSVELRGQNDLLIPITTRTNRP
jgi:hypothetical protein